MISTPFIDFRFRSLLILLAVAVFTAGAQLAPAAAATATNYTADQWNPALDAMIHADDTQSVTLPSGKVLWVFGDTIQVNGASTVGAYGYPHDAFVTQAPGSLKFTAIPGQYGYGWQQVPNWSDGSYFWMSTPVVDKNVLYILGQRVAPGSTLTVLGQYIAQFNASTLAFQKITQVPAGATGTTNWGGIVKTATGWGISGTHAVACTDATDCKAGDFATVPSGGLATPAKWQVYDNAIPATANVGTTLGLVKTATGWDAFTKTGDAFGGTTVERLQAPTINGAWTVNGAWPAPGPTGTVSYGVAVHPEQTAPAGQILVSYNVNDFGSICWPQFLYLPE